MKALVTKLQESVDNDNLPYFNGVVVELQPPYNNKFFIGDSINRDDPCYIKLFNGKFPDGSVEKPLTNLFDSLVPDDESQKILALFYPFNKLRVGPIDNSVARAKNIQDVFDWVGAKVTGLCFDYSYGSGYISAVKDLTSLTMLKLAATNLDGDISAVKDLTSLKTLDVSRTNVSGDISAVSKLTALTHLDLYGTNVSGDISAVSKLTALTHLSLSETNVSGDISAISQLTNLTALYFGNTNVSGKIDSLANLTKLTTLGTSLRGLSLTGDMSKIPAGVNFISLRGRKVTTNFTWTANGRQNATLLAMEESVPFDTVSMDNMFIDQATCTFKGNNSQPWTKTISVSGTRTSASDAAVTAIQNMGVTITGVTKQA